jgi:hypothetical protein
MDKLTSDLDQFKNQLNNPNKNISFFKPDGLLNNNSVTRIKKNLVLSFTFNASGCDHIRGIFLMTYLNAVFAKSYIQNVPPLMRTCTLPFFTFDEEILMQTRSLFFPRIMSDRYLAAITKYKQIQKRFGCKLIYDLDDFIWKGDDEGEDRPNYNTSCMRIPQEHINTVEKIMSVVDEVCVSTEFLRDYVVNKLKIKNKVTILPNCIPKYFYGPNPRLPITEKLNKPKFIYTGSPCHYDNEHKFLGDFDNAWREFIIKNVVDNKIEFMCLGSSPLLDGTLSCPWFFDSIRDKIKLVKWHNSYQYHIPILEYKPDFSFGPLIPNYFNYSKSNIRFLESCAYGAVFIGTTFTSGKPSPYDCCFEKFPDNCTVEDIEQRVFGELVYPDNFNKIIKDQWQYMDDTGSWLESKQYMSRLLKIF